MIYSNKKVVVIGLGYIGLPTALLLANKQWHVIGIDSNPMRVYDLQQGRLYIKEPQLEYYFINAQKNNNFSAKNALCSESCSDFYIIAVPTPCRDNKADLTFVWQAIETIIPVLKINDTIIIESTIPVGTTQKVSEYIYKAVGYTSDQLHVAHSPERVMPGNIVHELCHNDRVIGGVTVVASQKAAELYSTFVLGQLTIVESRMAEAVKLVENSYRDVMLACTYQVAAIAQKANLNEYELIALANKHPRVNLLQPTAGVGGHCIAIDPWFLIESFPEETILLKTARVINNQRPLELLKRIKKTIMTWQENNKILPQILIAGITYKADSDDVRESPALFIAKTLAAAFNTITICEPNLAFEQIHEQLPTCAVISVQNISTIPSDIVLFLVPHTELRAIELQPQWHVLDFCGILHQKERDHHHETTLFREKRC